MIGELPEQVPYQEWLHSEYKETRSCQSCHMPEIKEGVPITSVFGEPRPGVSRHTFPGGNFFMQRMLNRFRNDLAVVAEPQELDAAANRTIAHLQSEAAEIFVRNVDFRDRRLVVDVAVENLAGHKLPTAYPSRRVWLHVTVRDRGDEVVFESGALRPNGSIEGNDNDDDASRFEPHYTEVTREDQVQIYEAIMVGQDGTLTTGLLTAVRYVKDNRLLPRGFAKDSAHKDVAVHGEAEGDGDFRGWRRWDPLFDCRGGCPRAVPGGSRAVVSAHRLSLGDESQGLRRDGAQALRRLLRGDGVRFRRGPGTGAGSVLISDLGSGGGAEEARGDWGQS